MIPMPGGVDSRPDLPPALMALAGRNAAWLNVLHRARQVAPTPYPLLLTGETGTGKTALAQAIHHASGRTGQLVALNCAALTPTLVESQLFGYVKGAFTGATKDTPGLFELAQKGTLFLDELGDLALDAQAKLLRAIEQRVVRRVGGDTEISIDVRIIGATHQPLEQRIATGQFREDLYYRVNAFVLQIPPLRDRKDDLPALAASFLHQEAASKTLAADTLAILADHAWPGNLRELQSVVRQAVVQSGDAPIILPEHLPPMRNTSDRRPLITAHPSITASGESIVPHQLFQPPPEALVTKLREVMTASGAQQTPAWAKFLLALAEHRSDVCFGRTDILPLLRDIGGPQLGERALAHRWNDVLRPQLLATGLVTEMGRRLQIDTERCKHVVATRGLTHAPISLPSPLVPSVPPPPPDPASAAVTALNQDNLPKRDTELIGREAEVKRIMKLVADHAVVTLLGAGGIGKTSVAVRTAQQLATDFPGGRWFVDLTPLDAADGPARLAQSVAQAINTPLTRGDAVQEVGQALAARNALVLVVLDNFEHVVDLAPATLGQWCRLAPNVKWLVTSRTALELQGEILVELAPLAMPTDSSALELDQMGAAPAVRLFVQRATQADPNFALTAQNAADVAAICRKLDGLPLALELAAVRLAVMPADQLAQRLDRKFDFLRTTRRDAPQHQRALRQTLEWSWDLLQPHEQSAFMQLCSFRGGFTTTHAAAVIDLSGTTERDTEILAEDVVQSLWRKSWLVRQDTPHGPRFNVLAINREFGLQRRQAEWSTQAETELARRHGEYFAHWATRMATTESGVVSLRSARHEELSREFDNLVAARDWAASTQQAKCLAQTTASVAIVLFGRAHQSVILTWCAEAAANVPLEAVEWRVPLELQWCQASLFLFRQLDETGAKLNQLVVTARQHAEATHSPQWRYWLGEALYLLATWQTEKRLWEDGLRGLGEAEACFRQVGAMDGVINCLGYRGIILTEQGRLNDAVALLGEAAKLAGQARIPDLEASWLTEYGRTLTNAGQMQAAITVLKQALDMSRHVRCIPSLHLPGSSLQGTYFVMGEYAESIKISVDAEALARSLGRWDEVTAALIVRARALSKQGDAATAVATLIQAEHVARQHQFADLARLAVRHRVRVLFDHHRVAEAAELLPEILNSAARSIERFLTLVVAADVLWTLGRKSEAAQLASECLELSRQLGIDHAYPRRDLAAMYTRMTEMMAP